MTYTSNKLPQTLPTKSMSQAVEEAKALINLERSQQITGLYCRWSGINRFMMKYWRFKNVTGLIGASGSGKSAILNMLEDDFTNPEMNPYFHYKMKNGIFVLEDTGKKDETNKPIFERVLDPKIIVIAFKYEMDAADEVIRNLSGKVEKSYANLVSGEVIRNLSGEIITDEHGKDKYNSISDEEFDLYSKELDKLKNKPIIYIENSGNLEQLYNTCKEVKEKNPDKQLIVTLDHSLLSQKLSEKDDLELSSATAHTAIKLRKILKAMVIFLGQLNGEIEKIARRDNPALHFPVKTDIHCGSQIYWACDNVMIFNRPELLGIEKYGIRPFPMDTKGLIHMAGIKSRKNKPTNLVYENMFHKGNMQEIKPETKRWKDKIGGF